MMQETPDPHIAGDRSQPTAIFFSAASAYAIAVSALYLWGYWGPFSINILEYLGLADIVKVAAWPVGSVFIFVFLGMVLGEITPLSHLPEGGGQHTRVGRWLNKRIHWIAAIFTIFVIGLMLFAPPRSWPLIALLVGAIFSLPLRNYPPLVKRIPHPSVRSVVSFAVVVLPLFAYGEGRANSDSIRSGKKYLYVQAASEGIPSTGDPKSSMRYVGYAGNTFFFWDPTVLSLTIIPAATVRSMKLAKIPPNQ